jgi:hypothetical protein
MDESPPEIGMKLDFLEKNIRAEFIRLFQKCLTSRSYGMEHRMDHNRDLLTMRIFMRDKGHPHLKFDFDKVCEWLDYAPDDARRRIARVQTWDMIRDFLEANGSRARMPSIESHVDALFGLQQEQRGPAWAQFYDAALLARVPITATNIKAWVDNYKALPVETETVDEPKDISFEDESEKPKEEISQEEVPHGTKEAVAADVTPESGPLTQTPGQGPLFEHPERVRVAIEKIALACGGDDLDRRAEWRSILKDPLKIAFQDLLDWADHGNDDIRRIAGLATGNLRKGLHTAMRIVNGVIDSRTTLNFLFNRCQAEGGRLEHVQGPYKVVVTYHKDKDYDET